MKTDPAKLRFGALLRKYRNRAGMTQQELARAAAVSQSAVSELETGAKGTTRDYVARLDAALIARGVLVNSWDAYFSPNGTINYFKEIAERELNAPEIREYGLGLIPGLVQTECYARTFTQLGSPFATPKEVDAMVLTRMRRQEILDRPHPPVLTVLLDESTIMRTFSDPAVMRAQINRLITLSYRPRVTIQVVPMMAEGHLGLEGSFKLMTVSGGEELAYIEGHATGLTIKEPRLVQSYKRLFGELQGAALTVPDSRARMAEIRGEVP
ncbi:helix-turn-helix transcriptional regulator [Nocardiopsis sp. NPDC049922]|uniref:helix-turn-helix domain-containing protein n=1 Tax=Nocardiopsis sp. NPDC049922 TaxID=3155157 RepID=UPI0033FD35E5